MAETLKIVSSSPWASPSAAPNATIIATIPFRKRITTNYAIFEPGLNPKSWRVPNSRRITLYTDADRNKAAEIEARPKRPMPSAKRKSSFSSSARHRKLEAVPEKDRAELREAYRSKKRTDPQNAILKKYPSVRQISAVHCIFTTASTTAKSASSTPSERSLPTKKTTKRHRRIETHR